MELHELRSTWKSIEHHLSQQEHTDILPTDTADNRIKLLRRIYISMAITFAGLIIMIISIFWRPGYTATLWTAAFCVLLVIGIVAELRLAGMVRKIDLCNFSQTEILNYVIRIKKYYRDMELWISGGAIMLLGYLPFTSPVFNMMDMIIVWSLMIIGFTLEYIWYRKNTNYINQLKNWL